MVTILIIVAWVFGFSAGWGFAGLYFLRKKSPTELPNPERSVATLDQSGNEKPETKEREQRIVEGL